MLGRPGFRGATDSRDWPLEPIELVDGVPFHIVCGYQLAGTPEPPAKYVEYCLQTCDWTPTRIKGKSTAEKRAALAKLLASPKWKAPLSAEDRDYLSGQIRQ
jgi:hypothetical protein